MLNVLSLVSYKILPARVGGQKGIALFYKYFSRHVQLTCVTTQDNDPKAAEGYEVLNILSSSRLRYINPFYFFTLRKIIRQKQITHLLLEHPYYGWLAVMLKWFTGVKLIVHSHNMEGYRWRTLGKWWWKILWVYEKWVHRRADFNFFKQDEDMGRAMRGFHIRYERCLIVTYGIEWDHPPSAEEKKQCREWLLKQHNIPAHHTILLFNGAFDYLPNINGLKKIVEDINPLLQEAEGFEYTIILCGRNIPSGISSKTYPNVVFAGFVDDISLYFKGSDIFLNTVTEGGGIKTKLVEALGYNMNAVSSVNGAVGIDPNLCNRKLVLTDNLLSDFDKAIVRWASVKADIPAAYFDHFYWGTIAEKAARFIQTGHA